MSKDVTKKGYLVQKGTGGSSHWVFCMDVKEDEIAFFFQRPMSHQEADILEGKGAKILSVSNKELMALGDQKKSSPTFGHLINTYCYKFTLNFEEWLLT